MKLLTVLSIVLLSTTPFSTALRADVGPESPPLTWTGCGVSLKAFMAEMAAAWERKTGQKILLTGGGATKGIRAVASGESDLGGSCRHAMDVPEEADAVLIPLAWDALAVIVHGENPLSSISEPELDSVLSGRITDWRELGVEALGPIHLHAREGKISGVGYMARTMIFSDPDRDFAAHTLHPSTGPLESAIENDPSGIGLTGISSALRRTKLRVLDFEGVHPSPETIRDGSYRLVRPLFLAVPANYREIPAVSSFVDWARSPDGGQAVISGTGAVPVFEVTESIWERYFNHMAKAKQDANALRRILADLAAYEAARRQSGDDVPPG